MSTVTPTPTAFPSPTPSFLATDIFGIPLSTVLWIIIIIAIAVSIERFLTRYLTLFAKRTKLEPNVANNLALAFRIMILIAGIALISRVSGVTSDWIVSVSAIGAAAVGFASQKTIGNFIAGIFLMLARPFKVGNYVRIGTVEGIVSEVTINYTKIITQANNIVSISNLQILDRDITNFLYEGPNNQSLYCYTFEVAFDHSVSGPKIAAFFKHVFESYCQDLPTIPSATLIRSTAFERVYLIYLYVTNPEDIFTYRPKITEELFCCWDDERAKTKN
jgi:small-conductance mechanosensitive channel